MNLLMLSSLPLYDDLPPIKSHNQSFSSHEYAMLDDSLGDFISTKTSSSNLKTSNRLISMINLIDYKHILWTPNKPIFLVQGASSSQTSLNKPLFVVQGVDQVESTRIMRGGVYQYSHRLNKNNFSPIITVHKSI